MRGFLLNIKPLQSIIIILFVCVNNLNYDLNFLNNTIKKLLFYISFYFNFNYKIWASESVLLLVSDKLTQVIISLCLTKPIHKNSEKKRNKRIRLRETNRK